MFRLLDPLGSCSGLGCSASNHGKVGRSMSRVRVVHGLPNVSDPLSRAAFQSHTTPQYGIPIGMLRKKLAAVLATSVLASIAACNKSPSEPDPKPEPGIQIVAGADVADTIQAAPVQALVVQVIDQDRKPKSGLVVRFESMTTGTGLGVVPTVLVGPVASNSFASFVADTTDASGRAFVRVRLGTRAGPGGVVVSVPALGFRDTASYTIQSGAATRLVSTPKDTTLFVGRSFTLRGSVVDRHGNARADAVTYRVSSGPLAVNSGTRTVSASAVGRGTLIAQAQGLSDTTYVSVVPEGTIAAYTLMEHTGHQLAIYTLRLDGSELKKVIPTIVGGGYFGEMPSTWTVDGKQLVYHDNNSNHTKQLYVYDFTTGARRRFLAPTAQLPSEAWPHRSHDGQWVYFTGGDYGAATTYRARVDGTGREQILHGAMAAPAPDGTRIAYANASVSGSVLHVRNLQTGATSSLGVTAATPRWAPSGEEIAYIALTDTYALAGELRAIKPDGTGSRALTRSATPYRGPFDYSPDGKYIIAATRQGVLTVIDLATGEEIPVRLPSLGHGLLAPAWKP